MTIGNEEFDDCYFCGATGEVFMGEQLVPCPKCDGKKLVICGDQSERKECSCHIN